MSPPDKRTRDDYDAVEVARGLHRESVRERIKEYSPDPHIDALAKALLDNVFDRAVDPDRVAEAIKLVVQGYKDDAKRFVVAFNKGQFDRLLLLQQRMDMLEDDLFDPDRLSSMPDREKVRLYGNATIRQKELIKQIYQAVEMEFGLDEADDVMKKAGLEALTPVQRHKVVQFIDLVMQKMTFESDIVDAEFTESDAPKEEKAKPSAAPKKKAKVLPAPKKKVRVRRRRKRTDE